MKPPFKPRLLLALLFVASLVATPTAPHAQAQDQEPTPVVAGDSDQDYAEIFDPSAPEDTDTTPAPSAPEATVDVPSEEAPDPVDMTPIESREVEPMQVGKLAVDVIVPPTVRAGQELTYTVLYTNTTATPQNEVWIDVAVSPIGTPPVQAYSRTLEPLGVEPVIITTSNQITNLQWRIGNVAAGGKGQLRFVVVVSPDRYPTSGKAQTILGNTSKAYIGGQPNKGGVQDGSDNSGVLVVGPVFALNKVAAPKTILAGEEVTYTITLGNSTDPKDQANGRPRPDAITATNVVLFDKILPNAELRRATPGYVYTDTTRLLTWTPASPLLPNQTQTYTVVLRLAPNAADCSSLANTDIDVSSSEMPFKKGSTTSRIEIAGRGDSATIQEPVVVELTASNAAPFANEQSTIFIAVKNYLPQALSGITLTAASPTRSVATSQPSGVTVNADNTLNVVTWQNLSLPPGSLTNPSITRLSVTLVYSRLIGTFRTNVSATVPPIPLPPSNIPLPQKCIRTKAIGIAVQPLVEITKEVDNSSVQAGIDEVEYTIEVQNISGQSVSGLVVTDTLPNNASSLFLYKDNSATQGAIVDPTRTIVTWRDLSLDPGETVFLKFKATPYGSAGANACYNNVVSADSVQSQIENYRGAVVCLEAPFDIEKTITPGAVDPTLEGDARNVVVTIRVREIYRPGVAIEGPVTVFLKDDPNGVSIGGSPSTVDTELKFLRVISYTNGTENLSDTARLDTDEGVLWDRITLNQVGGGFSVSLLFRVPGGKDQYQGRIFNDRACVGYRPNTFFGEVSTPVDHTRAFNYCIYDDASVVLNRNTVRVSKTVDRQRVGLGERVKYSLSFQNQSQATVTGVTISDTLPLNFRFDGMATTTSPTPTTGTIDGQVNLKWGNLSIPAGQTLKVEFFARVPDFIGRYINQVWGESSMTGANKPTFLCATDKPDGCVYNQDGIAVGAKHIPGVDIEQRITIEPSASPTTIKPGDLVTYTISLVSNNNIPYQNTTISTTLPDGFTYQSTLDNGGQPTVVNKQLVWKSIIVPAAGANKGVYRLRFVAKAPTRIGVYRLRVDASSPTGTIPTADRAATVIVGSDKPALTLTAPTLAELESTIQAGHALINPETISLTVSAITTTLPAGLDYAGMVITGTVSPKIVAGPNNSTLLVWSNLVVPPSTSEDMGYISLDFRVKMPAVPGKHTVSSIATASKAIDMTNATVTITVAKLRYFYMGLVLR